MNIENQSISNMTTSINPLFDTWGVKKSAGSWGLTPTFDFTLLSDKEINIWYIKSVKKTLNAFVGLARVWSIYFYPSYELEINGVVIQWQSDNSYEEYVEKIFTAIEKYPYPIEGLEMKLELFVFVRTQQSPAQPIQAWIKNLGELVIWGGREYGSPYLGLSMHHTLFYPFSYINGEDNQELFFLNQPLLEKALRRWEEEFGEISEVEGLPGIYKYGFLPDEEWDKS